jgi:subtilisin family serine protease
MLSVRPAYVLALSVLASSIGCGGGGADAVVESSLDPRRNVLVVDDGFDPTAPDFRGRVAAFYSIVCDHAAPVAAEADAATPVPIGVDSGTGDDSGAGDGGAGDGPSLPERKAALITALQVRDSRCHLSTGVEPKPDPLAPVARYRDRWNGTIRGNKFASSAFTEAQLAEIREAQKALGKARFHGTATAGLIAHANPAVRLVLVEERLGTAESIMTNFSCFQQQDIDDNVTLFTDPEVRQAYIERPFSSLDDDFRALQLRHHIGVLNESFGTLSRVALEELQMLKGCAPVDLRRYFALFGELDGARAVAHPDPDALLVKSAGNDHSQIDGSEDHPMCAMPGTPRLIVGAYDDTGALTDFTNFGRCVDAIAPGFRIIAPIPGGWYLPLSGTSFSAPLTARLVSVNPEPVPFSAAAGRDLVLSMRDSLQRIPVQRFPRELLYDPNNDASHWALRLDGEVMPPEPALINVRKLGDLQALLRLGRRR